MATRIYHRYDTKANWDAAVAAGGGKLMQGELGIVVNPVTDATEYIGFVGTSAAPLEYEAGALLFRAVIPNVGQGVTAPPVFEPLSLKVSGSIPANATIVWDAAEAAWKPSNEILSLETYPSADGVVAWDQSAGQFTVGAAVSTVGIDGGSY